MSKNSDDVLRRTLDFKVVGRRVSWRQKVTWRRQMVNTLDTKRRVPPTG